MKHIFQLTVLVLLLAAVAPSPAQELNQDSDAVMAIVDFRNTGAEDGDVSYLTSTIPENLATSLANHPRVTVVERSMLERALRELNLQSSGVVDAETAAQLGAFVGANRILLGSFAAIQGRLNINARTIDVTTGEVLSTASVRGSVRGDLFALIDDLALEITNNLYPEAEPEAVAVSPARPEEKRMEQQQVLQPAPEGKVTQSGETQSTPAQPQPSGSTPMYKKPMFWIATSAVLVGVVALAAAASSAQKKDTADVEVTIQVP